MTERPRFFPSNWREILSAHATRGRYNTGIVGTMSIDFAIGVMAIINGAAVAGRRIR
jgi:hypothetical protein